MPNTQKNNGVEHFNKERNLLHDLLMKNEKSLNQFQNGLMQIKRIRIKKRQRTNLSQTKKCKIQLRIYSKIRLSKPDELERIAKIIRIKNYEEMTKEMLIISLLKSKQSVAELFNNNDLYDNKISDIRRILHRLRDILPRKYRKILKKSSMKQNIMKIFQKKMKNILENQ